MAEDGERDNHIVMFATEANLHILAAADTIFVDGTFHMSSTFLSGIQHTCCQIWKHFPLVYCLLPNKTRETYERVFTVTKEKVEELLQTLEPTTLVSNFELSIIQAAKLSFPTTISKGCTSKVRANCLDGH